MFLHERGAYNTMYFTAYFGSLMVRYSQNKVLTVAKICRSVLLSQDPWLSIVAGAASSG